MNEKIEAYDGANQEGQWVFDSQGVASDEGFGHVSKDWYPKTISYDEGMDQLEAEQGHRQDYLVPVADLDFGVKAIGTTPLRPRQDGIAKRGVALYFGGIVINEGDYLYADADGVVVAPRKLHD